MSDHERRIFYEPRAESDPAPGDAANDPAARKWWVRSGATAAAVLALVVAGWWVSTRPFASEASSVEVISVTGSSDSAVVELWADWWRAYAEVREAASFSESGASFNPGPLEELAADSQAAFQAVELLDGAEADGGRFGVGEPSEIRLAPHIQVDDALATITDCVYLDPVPWPGLRHADSRAGTAVMIAEAQLTVEGWRISEFGPELLVQQLAAGPCRAGER